MNIHFWAQFLYDIAHDTKVFVIPGQATPAAHMVSFWVEKNPVPSPNRRALDWSVVLTVGQLSHAHCLQDNIVVSNEHN